MMIKRSIQWLTKTRHEDNSFDSLLIRRKWRAALRFVQNSADNIENSALLRALQANAPDVLIYAIVAAKPSSIHYKDDSTGHTPLHTAVASGCHEDVVDFIIRVDPDSANKLDIDERTPLHLACVSGNITESQIVMFYNLGFDLFNKEDKFEATPLECYITSSSKVNQSILDVLMEFTGHCMQHRKLGNRKDHQLPDKSSLTLTEDTGMSGRFSVDSFI